MKSTRRMAFGNAWRWLVPLALAAALPAGLVGCGDGDDDGGTGGLTPRALTAGSILSGEQEVPPVITGAVGSGSLTLQANNVVGGSITLDGMTATAAHIHEGAVGVDGPVIVPLVQTAPGVWSVPPGTVLTEQQRTALLDGRLYFNAHNAANPDGEIRGQIGREVYDVRLSPAQEVPPRASSASGTGRLVLDPVSRRFSASVVVTGMAATAAHIHPGAAGTNGPVLFPLTQTAPGSGTFVSAADATMTEEQVAQLRSGGLYFNAHSAALPDGEIRGQIARHVGLAFMTGAQEVPPTPSTATGTGTLVIDPATRAASGSIRVSGMTVSDAHIHIAAAGVAGPIIVPLANAGGGVWNVPAGTRLSAEHYAAFQRGDLYFNAHSTQFPTGEIRGQIR